MSGSEEDNGPLAGPWGYAGDWLAALVAIILALVAAVAAFFLTRVSAPAPPTLVLDLAAGCGRVYYPGEFLDIQVESSADGQVTVTRFDPQGQAEELFREPVTAGVMLEKEARVVGLPGTWRLEASLDGGQARDRCSFVVSTEFTVLYDFIREAPRARWSVYAPHLVDDPEQFAWGDPPTSPLGYAGWQRDAVLEDGSLAGRVLETRPPWMPYAEIWGQYNLDRVGFQPGDRFSARVGLLEDARWGDVIFRVQIHDDAAATVPIFAVSVPDTYLGDLPERWFRRLDFPLPYAPSGKVFYLQVDGGSVPRYDRAVWIEARIERPSAGAGP